jgi:hypothetical protein
MKHFCTPTVSVLLIAMAGCSMSKPVAESKRSSTIDLSASLISPVDIKLKWNDTGSDVVGHTIEWGTESNGEYVVVAFAPSHVDSFVHSDVVPVTTCYYRVRPYFGPASAPVEITTGMPNQQINTPDPTWAEPRILPTSGTLTRNSIRTPATIAAAAPMDLKARLVTPTGIQLTWVDQATDEEGYMVEVKMDGMPDFAICAIVDPNVNSFGIALVPPETTAWFRVRPFYYGRSSNIASQTTGLRPAGREEASNPFPAVP